MKKCLTALLLILLGYNPAWAGYVMEVIELKGRPADEIIPIIKPFAGPDGTVTGTNNQLIIRTTPERMQNIINILEKIDRPQRSLMIYVRQGLLRDGDREHIGAGVDVSVGDHAKIEAGEPAPNDSIRLRARTTRTHSDLDTISHIQTIEGKPAFIATGKAIPVPEQTTYIAGGVVHQQETIRYRDATTGFYVVPYLMEDQIRLQISPHMEHRGQMGETFDIQQAHTTIIGRLGEWIPIGGVQKDRDEKTTGILRRHTTTSRDERQIFLKVEEIK